MAATPGLSYRQSQQLNQGAFAMSNGVPAGGAFGLGIQYAMAPLGVEGWGVAGTSLLVAFGCFAVAQIGLMVPITPGGLGTVDAAMIALLTALGVDAGAATAADLVWRAASVVPQIVIGVVALITWSRQGTRALAEHEAAAASRPRTLRAPGTQRAPGTEA